MPLLREVYLLAVLYKRPCPTFPYLVWALINNGFLKICDILDQGINWYLAATPCNPFIANLRKSMALIYLGVVFCIVESFLVYYRAILGLWSCVKLYLVLNFFGIGHNALYCWRSFWDSKTLNLPVTAVPLNLVYICIGNGWTFLVLRITGKHNKSAARSNNDWPES